MSGYLRLLNDVSEGYFKHNKIEIGEGIPTKGTYKKGDLIINTGRVPSECPMWLCVYDGSPGRWIGVGKVAELPDNVLLGDIIDLSTNDKSNVINAINEIFGDVRNLKSKIDSIDGTIIDVNRQINEIFDKSK